MNIFSKAWGKVKRTGYRMVETVQTKSYQALEDTKKFSKKMVRKGKQAGLKAAILMKMQLWIMYLRTQKGKTKLEIYVLKAMLFIRKFIRNEL